MRVAVTRELTELAQRIGSASGAGTQVRLRAQALLLRPDVLDPQDFGLVYIHGGNVDLDALGEYTVDLGIRIGPNTERLREAARLEHNAMGQAALNKVVLGDADVENIAFSSDDYVTRTVVTIVEPRKRRASAEDRQRRLQNAERLSVYWAEQAVVLQAAAREPGEPE